MFDGHTVIADVLKKPHISVITMEERSHTAAYPTCSYVERFVPAKIKQIARRCSFTIAVRYADYIFFPL